MTISRTFGPLESFSVTVETPSCMVMGMQEENY
jgi:hypothetical protein